MRHQLHVQRYGHRYGRPGFAGRNIDDKHRSLHHHILLLELDHDNVEHHDQQQQLIVTAAASSPNR
jgi:hypothetical protein